jgi:hypothetical protein
MCMCIKWYNLSKSYCTCKYVTDLHSFIFQPEHIVQMKTTCIVKEVMSISFILCKRFSSSKVVFPTSEVVISTWRTILFDFKNEFMCGLRNDVCIESFCHCTTLCGQTWFRFRHLPYIFHIKPLIFITLMKSFLNRLSWNFHL